MKKICSCLLVLCVLTALLMPQLIISISAEEYALKLDVPSAILMDATTGEILFEQNAEEARPPASVTKVMTLLLVMEAIEEGKIAWADMVTTSDRAASMGGSQIFLEVGEQMTVEDMVKSVVIASANDAALALAEFVAGSEETFVEAMNQKAAELGMTSTHFENTNGLDDTVENHLTSAKDIAIMSRELIKHPKILEYSSIWMDTVRDGAFTLTNTNRLVRFYPGATGLKTGSTSKAKFCITATAERNGLSLIAVVMGAETRDIRNEAAKKMLDYGFANYSSYQDTDRTFSPIPVEGGMQDAVSLTYSGFSCVLPKGKAGSVKAVVTLPEQLQAPIEIGKQVGKIEYYCGEEKIGEVPVVTTEKCEKISYTEILRRLIKSFAFS